MTDDVEGILAAVNAYKPITYHHSWSLSQALGFKVGGAYVKVGGLKMPQKQFESLLAERGIKLAEHFRSYIGPARPRNYDFRRIKSRFGESVVERDLSGDVINCDNDEARAFYDAAARAAVEEISQLIDGGDIEAAKTAKRRIKREGQSL
jgi:hypothetical protein